MDAGEGKSVPSGLTQDLCRVVADNLKKLIARNHITQRELAEQVGVTAASMTDYCKARRLPTVEFFFALKKLYGVSIDEFLTGSVTVKGTSLREAAGGTPGARAETGKYCGIYYVYYFNTGKFKGGDTLTPAESLLYGLMCVYETPSFIDAPRLGCAAVLGITDRDSVPDLKKKLEGFREPGALTEYIGKEYPGAAYFGDFELSREHIFVSLSHAGMDKALLILHRVDSNKENYTGGIGTINSISRGRERLPVVQFMGISRHPLALTAEEIHLRLLLDYPAFRAEAETEEMIRTFKALYAPDGSTKEQFTEYQKSVFVRSTLEMYIRKSLERNVFRYGKISEQDDDDWYHAVKEYSEEDSPE